MTHPTIALLLHDARVRELDVAAERLRHTRGLERPRQRRLGSALDRLRR